MSDPLGTTYHGLLLFYTVGLFWATWRRWLGCVSGLALWAVWLFVVVPRLLAAVRNVL